MDGDEELIAKRTTRRRLYLLIRSRTEEIQLSSIIICIISADKMKAEKMNQLPRFWLKDKQVQAEHKEIETKNKKYPNQKISGFGNSWPNWSSEA